jgi:hypothetical protein
MEQQGLRSQDGFVEKERKMVTYGSICNMYKGHFSEHTWTFWGVVRLAL